MWNKCRAATVGAATLGWMGFAMTPAVAHVTVHSDEPTRGASDAAVIFRTPNEEDHAATVKLQVFFPTEHPLLDVLVEPHHGWRATTKVDDLAKPVTTDDGKITEAVSEVTWTANRTADGLQPGQGDDFVVIAGELPDTPSVTFRVLQTYSNGDVVKWIETQAPGADEPEHPAPVLTLAPATSAKQSTSNPSSPTATTRSSSSSSSDGLGRGLAIAALVVAIGAAVLAGRGQRRQPNQRHP